MSDEETHSNPDDFEEEDWPEDFWAQSSHWTRFNRQGETEGEESTPTAVVSDDVSHQSEGFSQGETPSLTEMVPAAVPLQQYLQEKGSALIHLASVAVSQGMSSQPSTSSHETIEEFISQQSFSSQHFNESTVSTVSTQDLDLLEDFMLDDFDENSGDETPLPDVALLDKALTISNAKSDANADLDYEMFGSTVQDAVLLTNR